MCLSRDAAGFVDPHVAPVAHKIGPAPADAARRRRPRRGSTPRPPSRSGRPPRTPGGSTSSSPRCPTTGRCTSRATWTWPTRSTSTPPSQRVPPSCAALGSASPSMCAAPRRWVTWLRAQLALGFTGSRGHPEARVPRRQVVLHAHIAAAAVTGATGTGGAADLARVQEVLAAITTEQVRQWCGNPHTDVTVKPVLDLAEHISVMVLRSTLVHRLKAQTATPRRHLHPPWCTRPRSTATASTGSPTTPTTPEPRTRPAPATSPRPAGPTIGPRPPAPAGPTSPSSPAPTCGEPAGLPVPPTTDHRHHRRHPRLHDRRRYARRAHRPLRATATRAAAARDLTAASPRTRSGLVSSGVTRGT